MLLTAFLMVSKIEFLPMGMQRKKLFTDFLHWMLLFFVVISFLLPNLAFVLIVLTYVLFNLVRHFVIQKMEQKNDISSD